MTAVAEKHPPKVVNLCRALKKGMSPISKLSEELQADEVLGYAFADGLIQVGRQAYSLVAVEDGKVRKKDGKNVLDEYGRIIVDKDYKVNVESDWSWMDRDSKGRAPLSEVISEEVGDGVPGLHVRLTAAGLAATI